MSEQHASSDKQTDPDSGIGTALSRLNKALDALDGSIDASLEIRKQTNTSSQEVQQMAGDRTKLARQLDECEERAQRLSKTNKEVSRRLVAAMETIRSVLDH